MVEGRLYVSRPLAVAILKGLLLKVEGCVAGSPEPVALSACFWQVGSSLKKIVYIVWAVSL